MMIKGEKQEVWDIFLETNNLSLFFIFKVDLGIRIRELFINYRQVKA